MSDGNQLDRIIELLEINNRLVEKNMQALEAHNKIIRDIDEKLRKVTINTSNM